MADFVQTMKDWKRMCNAMEKLRPDDSCCGCRLEGYGCPAIYEDDNHVDYADVEKNVTAWAAEHQEPVYPSIAKYLERFGIMIRRDGSVEADFFRANEPMSAEMAKLLGISPGEGENEKTD